MLLLVTLVPARAANTESKEVALGQTSITIPIPAGFAEPQEPIKAQVTSYVAEASATVSQNIVVLLSRRDISDAKAGRPVRMDRYFVFGTLKSLSSKALSRAEFASVRDVLATKAQALAEKASSSVQAALDSATIAGSHPSIRLKAGYMKELGVAHNRDDSICTLSVSPLTMASGGREQTSLIAIAAVLAQVREKVVTFNIYSTYRSSADMRWIKQQCDVWSRQLQQSNP